MKKAFFRVLILLVLILPTYLTFFANKNPIRSVQVNHLKDQLSNAQLSFFGRLASFSGSVLTLDLTANPSRVTANLFTGDTLAVANSGVTTVSFYTVKNIGSTSGIELTATMGTTTPNAYIIATRSAIHTITFTPAAFSSGEKWEFLIKATDRSSTGELPMDGIPDQLGFDLGATSGVGVTGLGTRLKTTDVICPGNSAGTTASITSVGTTIVITSGINVGQTGSYHLIQCTFGAGVSNSGIATSMVVGKALNLGSQLINPAPGLSHTVGQANNSADTYAYAIRQLNSSGVVQDITFGKLAITESVRVTAIVDPTITFIIDNVGSTTPGDSRCSTTLSNGALNTTANTVSFGPLNLSAFNDLSQRLQCTTNSQYGYVIQAFENNALTMIGNTSVTIPDTNCGGNNCTATVQTAWTTNTASGFGYAIEVGTTTGTAANVTIGITTPGHYRPFGVGSGNAQTIISRSDTPAATDSVYVCYRATASTVQQAGTYENSISYIATATF